MDNTTTQPIPAYGSTVIDAAGRSGTARFNPNDGTALTPTGIGGATTITSANLSPVSKTNLPTASATTTNNDSLTSYLQGISATVPGYQNNVNTAEKTNTQGNNDLLTLMQQLGGQTGDTLNAESDAGIPSMNRDLKDLQTLQTQQLAGYISNENKNTTTNPVGQEKSGQTNAEIGIQRQHGIDALLTSSLVQAKQGDISAAQANVDRAISVKYAPIKSAIDIQSQIIKNNYENLTRADKKLADAKLLENNLKGKQIDNEQSLITNAIQSTTTGIGNGSIDPITGNNAIKDLVSGKIGLSDFYGKIGVTPDSSTPTGANINGYDITSYATDPTHEQKVLSIYNSIGDVSNSASADATIKSLSPNSPLTGQMIMDAAAKYSVDPKLMLALMVQDSSLGTAGKAVTTKNPGNVGNTDSGATQTFKTWGDGVDAVAKWLQGHKATTTTADYNLVGLLSKTNYNPNNSNDKNALNYLDSYLKSTNGALPTASTLFGSARGANQQKFINAENRAKELFGAATGEGLPDLARITANKALITANNKVLNSNALQADAITKNFDLAINGEITNNINKNATVVNGLLNPIRIAFGDPATVQALVSNGTISQEFANLLAIKNNGGTTVSDKEMAANLIPFGTSVDAQKAVVERLKAEAANIHSSIATQNQALYKVTDPLQRDSNNPNRVPIINTEPLAKDSLQKYITANPDKATTIKSQMQASEKVLGRKLSTLEFLQAHPEYIH